MQYLIFLLIFLMILDLLSSWFERTENWMAVVSGRVDIETLRKLTGVVDQNRLEQLFGSRDGDFKFAVTYEQVRAARTQASRIFSDPHLDRMLLSGLALAAALHLFYPEGMVSWGLVLLVAGYEVVKAAWVLKLRFSA